MYIFVQCVFWILQYPSGNWIVQFNYLKRTRMSETCHTIIYMYRMTMMRIIKKSKTKYLTWNSLYLSLIGIIFEMRLLNMRINFYLLQTFCPYLGIFFVLFLLSLCFGQISPLAFFRWFTATSDRNADLE